MNFAFKAEVARTFLDSKRIAYQTARSDKQLSPADIGDIARPFTVHIECEQAGSRPRLLPRYHPRQHQTKSDQRSSRLTGANIPVNLRPIRSSTDARP